MPPPPRHAPSASWLADYTRAIAAITGSGDATEHSYRTAIDRLLHAAANDFAATATVLQEPSRTTHIGAPDFRITAKGGGIIGYVECKKPGDNLGKQTTKTQVAKYRALSGNIVLTDSWRWLLLRDGKIICDVTLTAKPGAAAVDEFTDLLRVFLTAAAEQIGDAKRLAAALAQRCAMLRDGLADYEHVAASQLHGLFNEFRQSLDADLTFARFADTFAQTLVYSLLLAKLKAPAGKAMDLYNVGRYIPANYPVIRDITIFLSSLDDRDYQNIRWIIDDILAITNGMDAAAVAESMSYRGRNGVADEDDPYIYFYENFLAAYDAHLRERRGVYYTPPPVVKFIVRAVDDLLRRDFNLPAGLAETDTVTALDFAAGTGTFMLEMIRSVLADAPAARRDMLTRGHILKNFHGFEFLMAPYVIAHLKLSQFLADMDVPLQNGERVNIFLANTLEPVTKQLSLPMMPRLADEVKQAQDIKDAPVLVITGNPPYSGHSQNKGQWIADLINDYKQVDGKPLQERNPKWLQDDYVKFIRFAQWKMAQVERGIVAIITNHAFLDNPTFRGMRQSLLKTFDTLYFLDLHGNSKKKETTPDGGKDENVFDIQQGVAISVLVKNPRAKQQGVFHADFYGKRADKYTACLDSDIQTVQWRKLKPATPFYLFVPRDEKTARQCREHYPIQNIFMAQSVGIVSSRDHFAFGFDAEEIKARIKKLRDAKIDTEHLRELYDLKDTRDWSLATARQSLMADYSFEKFLKPCLYRPFDVRWCYYGKDTLEFHRPNVMRHMLAGDNVGLLTSRATKDLFSCFCANVPAAHKSAVRYDITYLFPLYRYEDDMGDTARTENLQPDFRRWLDDRYGTAHTPEDILGCIYAILHSPDYRQRYADFLRTDFPRIPFPKDTDEFQRLAAIGADLMAAHLLRKHCTGTLAQHHGAGTSHRVDKIRYHEQQQRLYFNADEYFAPVPPDVFAFQIGGYQPLDKYLKSRKDRTLTLAETDTLRKTVNAIAFTISKMQEIDQ